jgi:hypothetical protein
MSDITLTDASKANLIGLTAKPQTSFPASVSLKELPGVTLQTNCQNVTTAINGNTNLEIALETFYIGTDKSGNPNVITNLENLKGVLSSAVPSDNLSTSNTKANTVQTYVNDIETKILPHVQLVESCLSESLQVYNKGLNQAQALLDESKERYESIKNPETNVSYYEGWFPIVRPMSEGALFGLFGAAIFMLLLSIFIFLRLAGVVINIQIPEIILPEFLMNIFTLPPNSQYYILGGIIAGIFGGIAYSYYLNRK